MRFLLTIFISAIAFQANATDFWTNTEDGFGADFPNPPVKFEAQSGYAYQATMKFDNGVALLAITVVPVSSEITHGRHKEYLEGANAGFIKSMEGNPSHAKVEWVKYGENRKRLNYAFDFLL